MTDFVRERLQFVLVEFGRTICDDPKRCDALLKDLCPNHKREVNLLLAALREGVAKELLNASPLVSIESIINRLSLKMHDNLGTAEHLAQWAVESWALVLGVQFNSSTIAPAPDNSKVGVGVPKSATQTNTPQSKAVQPTVAQKPVDHAATFEQFKQQVYLEAKKHWQKIDQQGELVDSDAPQWAAVIDEKTQLMWAVNSSKTANFPNPNKILSWRDAMAWAEYVNTQGWCGFNNWRLPTIGELKTLLTQHQQPTLYLKENIFNDINNKNYRVWSSSPVASSSGLAWIVGFYGGYDSTSGKSSSNYVRLVRSSQ